MTSASPRTTAHRWRHCTSSAHGLPWRSSDNGSGKLADEVFRRRWLGEHREVVGERVVVLLGRGGCRAVGEGQHLVTALVARSHGRLDAAVGEKAAEDDRRDSLVAQDEIEIGAGEGVEAALALDHDVALLRRQLVHDGGAPAALHEALAVDDALEDPVVLGVELT